MQQSEGIDSSNEHVSMLNSWNRETLLKEIDEGKKISTSAKRTSVRDPSATLFYDGKTAFSELKQSMKPLPTNDQIYFKMIRSNPDGKNVTLESSVLVDRIGYVEGNVIPFENTTVYGSCGIVEDVSSSVMFMGVGASILSMKEGETALFMINPDLGCGKRGAPPTIPPDAVLFYKIIIYKVLPNKTNLNEMRYEEEKHNSVTPPELKLAAVEEYKDLGNHLLEYGFTKDALSRYKFALKALNYSFQGDGMSDKNSRQFKLCITLMQNICIAYHKLQMFHKVSKHAKNLLTKQPNNIKAIYMLAKAKLAVGDKDTALHWVLWADKVSPRNKDFDSLRLQLNLAHKDEKKKMDEMAKKMFK